MVGVPALLVAHPAHLRPGAAGGVEQRALDVRARRAYRRAQPERVVAAHLVERQRPPEPLARVVRAGAASETERPEVVGRAGVAALLGAGGHEPHVAPRLDQPEPAGELRHHTEPRRVVVGAGRRAAASPSGPSRSGGSCAACRRRRSRCASGPSRARGTPARPRAGRRPGTSAGSARWTFASRALAAGRGAPARDLRGDAVRRRRAPARRRRWRLRGRWRSSQQCFELVRLGHGRACT